MLHFLPAGGQLLHGAAVDDIDLFRPQAQGRAGGVHGHVAAAYHRHPAALHDGGLGIVQIGLHQVGAGQELIGGIDALQGLAGNVHEIRQAGAGADEDRLVALLEELVHGQGFADDHVGLDFHPQLPESLHLPGHDGLGQTEFRNAVDQHAAGGMQGFEHRDPEPLLGQIPGAGEPGGAGADDGHAVAVGGRSLGLFLGVGVMPVRHEALQPADAHGIHFGPGMQGALAFALGFLGTDPAADGGQGGAAGDDPVGLLIVAFFDLGDEIGNLNIHGAAGDAGTVFAVQAAGGFLLGHLQGISQGHLLEIAGPDLRRLGGHLVFLRVDCHFYFAPSSRLQAFS